MDAGAKLSERDVCTKFITPALVAAGWDVQTQIREEVGFTKGRIIVRGRLVTRGKAKRADYVLYYRHLPLALIEAKDPTHAAGDGMQQALGYATTLDIPYVFSSNGRDFQFHDRSGISVPLEQSLSMNEFPGPNELWSRYRSWKGLQPAQESTVLQAYYEDGCATTMSCPSASRLARCNKPRWSFDPWPSARTTRCGASFFRCGRLSGCAA